MTIIEGQKELVDYLHFLPFGSFHFSKLTTDSSRLNVTYSKRKLLS